MAHGKVPLSVYCSSRLPHVTPDFVYRYWNRYPDAACDIESFLYLPIIEKMGKLPSEKFAHQPEIFRHCTELAKRHRLYESCLFHTTVNRMAWDEAACVWVVSTGI